MTYLFSFLFPFLLMMLFLWEISRLLGLRFKGITPTLGLAAASALAMATPVCGLPLGRWLISLNANFSIPLFAIVLSRITGNAFHRPLLDKRAVDTCAVFFLISGAVLYPMALGIGPFDPYEAGWRFSWLFAGVLVLTIGLLIRKNRFGMVLVFAVFAYDLKVLESSNFWDYIIDPLGVVWAALRLAWPRSFGLITPKENNKGMR